jgi:hypothetical protein
MLFDDDRDLWVLEMNNHDIERPGFTAMAVVAELTGPVDEPLLDEDGIPVLHRLVVCATPHQLRFMMGWTAKQVYEFADRCGWTRCNPTPLGNLPIADCTVCRLHSPHFSADHPYPRGV